MTLYCETSLSVTALPFEYLVRVKNVVSASASVVGKAVSTGISFSLSAPGAFSFVDPFALS